MHFNLKFMLKPRILKRTIHSEILWVHCTPKGSMREIAASSPLPVAPSLYILGLSHMLINEFKCIRLSLYVKMKIKQNLTNVISTKIAVQFFFWWNVTGSVHLTKSHFYLINLGRWQNIQTPLYGHPLNTDTSFWLRTVSFVPDYSLNHVNIFYKFNPLTNTHPCRQLWNALFVTFALWLIWRLLWKKDGIFAIIHFGQVLLNIHFSAALKALVYTW